MKRKKRLFALVLLVLAACASHQPAQIQIDRSAAVNPWTHLQLNNDPDNFQFIIASDRTGGKRPGIFSRAVEKINLLQPELVMCVGDLIEGYAEDETLVNEQWDEFDALVKRLQMPFFYLPGNHDQTNSVMQKIWASRRGRSFYHFVYKNVLFLCLNSESNVSNPQAIGGLSAEQLGYFRRVLAEKQNVRWTLVFLHKPLWTMDDPSWLEFEKMLPGRQLTVIAGHEHAYRKFDRNGNDYYILATTGGVSNLRGLSHGEFDHIVWVTMTDNGPVMANLMLDGIYADDMRHADMGNLLTKQPFTIAPLFVDSDLFTEPAALQIQLINDGSAPLDVQGVFHPNSHILPELTTLERTLTPRSSEKITVDMRSKEPIAIEEIEPLRISWTLKSELPNNTDFMIEVENTARPVRRYPCRRRQTPVQVDGHLDEWSALPFVVTKPAQIQFDRRCYLGPEDGSFAFAVEYDDENLYLAVQVQDEVAYAGPTAAPWQQDGIEIRLDAQPAEVRDYGKNITENIEILFIGLTPELPEREMLFYDRDHMPVGLQARCILTAQGHNTEIAVPIAYLHEKQGEPWSAFRLNITVDDFDGPDEAGTQLWWQPDWRWPISVSGSGTFIKE
ncbi:MAG TPA: metallophosphoesterase [bacterium]|nr:metallophosphoesterase [bacterium]HPG47052.1 metallophosphoesterase [bacterium]HPM99360.1 metallophosphoesterase [bacterium]